MKTASMLAPGDRNLNPHKEARVAMAVFGARYAAQSGGSMDFWDSLSTSDRKVCRDVLKYVESTPNYAPPSDFKPHR